MSSFDFISGGGEAAEEAEEQKETEEETAEAEGAPPRQSQRISAPSLGS